ncbi:MAG: excinuclease ABC subunit UvrC [Clostridia bacterium]|nr:excinuclease ABC subunit UvrC [Clostridia bacterium]
MEMKAEKSDERREELLRQALELPMTPGVYIMHDSSDRVIYVGKSRHLHDRVSQYFKPTEKNVKTARMVASVFWFEVIHCDTEIEALTLENTLIKQYTPRYNIKLKDAKSYPYIKLTSGRYPKLIMSRKRLDDGAVYFGPYSGTATVFSVISLVNKAFGLVSCRRKFPSDIGKERPCLYYQMGQCCGVCAGKVTESEYAELIDSASEVLRGNTSKVRKKLEAQMLEYAEAEQYEAAAKCRDTISALEKLAEKQKVVASPDTDQDVIGVYSDELGTVMCLLRIRGGALNDKLEFPMGIETIADSQAFVSLLFDHYRSTEDVPARLLLGFEPAEDDFSSLSALLAEFAGKKVPVLVPERGDNKKLCLLASENARQAALRMKRDTERAGNAAVRLAELLGLEVVPERIEAYDISNFGSEHITAGMIVSENGKFSKKDYRVFSVKTTHGADDYGALRETLERRFSYLLPDAPAGGSFGIVPDLILLDGGAQHLAVAEDVMDKMGVYVPCVGMVKDDFHKTRALVTSDGEVSIAKEREVYVLIYKIQEEVHRFTVSKMSAAKQKTVRTSVLEKIEGIGPAKAKAILYHFGGLAKVKTASSEELSKVRGISRTNAEHIREYFDRLSESKK